MMARPEGLEPPTLCFEDKSRKAISLLFLGSAYFLHHGFVWYSGVNGLSLDARFVRDIETISTATERPAPP